MSDIQLGDIGTVFSIETGAVLTGATTTEILIQKPDLSLATWTATVSGTKLTYTTVANDLDQRGVWKGHAHVILPSGDWRGSLFQFSVEDKFK